MLLCRSGCCLPLFGDAVVPMKTAFCFHFSFLAAALSGSSPSPAPPLSAAGGLAGKETGALPAVAPPAQLRRAEGPQARVEPLIMWSL